MPKVLQSNIYGVIYIEETGYRPVVTPEFYEQFPNLGDFPKTLPPCIFQAFHTQTYWEGAELRLLDNGWMEKGHATVFTPELPYTTRSCEVHMTEDQFKEWITPSYVTKYTLVIHGKGTKRTFHSNGIAVLHNTTNLDGLHATRVTYTISGSTASFGWTKSQDTCAWWAQGDMDQLVGFAPIVKKVLPTLGATELKVPTHYGTGMTTVVDGVTFIK
jgi:hypothetical protein